MRHKGPWLALAVVWAGMSATLTGQQQTQRLIILDPQQGVYYADANDRSIRALPVRDNIYMIVGAGANITVQTGDEGVLVVDSGSGAATNEKVLSLIRQLSTKPIHYIINTSFHNDHTGGNVALHATVPAGRGGRGGNGGGGGAAGVRAGIPIVAHENVLARMSAPTGKTSPTP